MTDIEKLQQRHREEAARKRAKLKERKARAHRLIERGAILEAAINEICPADKFSNDEIQKIVYFAILSLPQSTTYQSWDIESRSIFNTKGALIHPLGVCVRWKPLQGAKTKDRTHRAERHIIRPKYKGVESQWQFTIFQSK